MIRKECLKEDLRNVIKSIDCNLSENALIDIRFDLNIIMDTIRFDEV